MPFAIEAEPGEAVLFEGAFQASEKSVPFAIAISDRAIYLPAIKRLSLSRDPWYFRRLPLSAVREINVAPLRSVGLLLLSVLMVVGGAYLIVAMMTPILTGHGGKASGWPFAILVGGIVLPFTLPGRRGLRVVLATSTFKWKPPLVIDATSKQRIAALLDGVIVASRKAGIHTGQARAA
jgi:hypothetical protein